jgi:peptidoglycan/LPS O-acetylase OafA/YrhL
MSNRALAAAGNAASPARGGTLPQSRQNSIGFLRVALALSVLVSHGYGLGRLPNEPLSVFSDNRLGFGTLGVAGFFALSGYLITQSFTHVSSPWRYLWHRILRIFPGFWVCLLMLAFVLGPIAQLMEYGTLAHYFGRPDWNVSGFLRRNSLLTLNAHRIGDLFAHNPNPYNVDESLWTLEVEFRCYLAVMLLGMLRRLPLARYLVLLLPISLLLIYVSGNDAYCRNWIIPRHTYPMLYVFFAIGSLCYIYRKWLPMTRQLFYAALALALVTLHFGGMQVVLPLTWPYILLYLAQRLPLQKFDKRGDFSYGIYIYAFPVQQIVILTGIYRSGPIIGAVLNIGATIALTLPLAFLSWHLVEKPCLRLKSVRVFGRKDAAPRQAVAPTLAIAEIAEPPARLRSGTGG